MIWRVEDEESDVAKTLMQARAKLKSDGSWGLNSRAVEAINSVMLGVRQGWCLQVEVEENDEVLFLQGMEAFLEVMEPLVFMLNLAFSSTESASRPRKSCRKALLL